MAVKLQGLVPESHLRVEVRLVSVRREEGDGGLLRSDVEVRCCCPIIDKLKIRGSLSLRLLDVYGGDKDCKIIR